MLSYLPCGLSTEGNILKENYIHVYLVFSHLFYHEGIFFFRKINKAFKFYKINSFLKNISKTFSGIKLSTYQN